MTWWSFGMRVGLSLTRITISYNAGAFDKYYGVAGFRFMLTKRDVHAHGDEMEEQLWAMKRGL